MHLSCGLQVASILSRRRGLVATAAAAGRMMMPASDSFACRIGRGSRSYLFLTTTTTPTPADTNEESNTTTNTTNSIWNNMDDAVVLVRGDAPYGSREYLLVPNRHVTLEHVQVDKSLVLASLRAHRNVLFGAKAATTATTSDLDLAMVGPPLVQAAVQDAGSNGEQVQALAALHGLTDWVQAQLLQQQQQEQQTKDNNRRAGTATEEASYLLFADMTKEEIEAVTSIATGIPRPGHSVVGMGTYTAGERAWLHLARAFAATSTDTDGASASPAPECALYTSQGAQLVQMEHLAETSPAYLRSAGGTMARFFFL